MIVEEVEITQFSNEEISSILHKCDYIYITGGNTFFLLQELKEKVLIKSYPNKLNRENCILGSLLEQ